jgi:hypothetical protein
MAKRCGVLLVLALAGLAVYLALEDDPAQAHYPVGNVPTMGEIFSKFR